MRIASNTHLSAKRGSSSNQKEKRSYCDEKSYDRSSSFGRSCPRVYLYADEGTKSSISISRISPGVLAARNLATRTRARALGSVDQVRQVQQPNSWSL